MRLTRRDALAVLAGMGVLGGGSAAVLTRQARTDDSARGPSADDRAPAGSVPGPVVRTLAAAADVLYPSAVEGTRPFVETFALGRLADRPAHRDGLVDAVEVVDSRARSWYGEPFADLPIETRDAVLRELGADSADPDAAGSDAERVRFYVVNDLLYALYTSPTGGELAGTENPIGYPGGLQSYQRGP